ncbi:PREDICTED: EF-hand calcium-binding domain-containing protein 5 [Calidris pugnax]|uniref:EF-hand calcium-binding domain-containing protein 5 n=1 Tax=Calidris pugnax TaxID=198806 RepID=UPI00071CE652|nr:PREDICTED: EF-hand calcium-binding domain-containing protein 5 [Calidris pugnax]
MAARPEEAAQTAGLNHPSLGVKSMTATEMKEKQRKDKLPCLSNYAPWKDCFYEKVQQRCLNLQETKVKMIHAQKAKEEKVKKKEPCDWLSKEWFSEDKESLDTRIYLLDKLLPTLIPGVENLLMEVERKNLLAPDKEPTEFNPINFLGEYLMRHHPQYGISIKPGPYLRGMKMVLEQLKAEVPGTASERLARLKSEAKNKRKEREQVEIMKSQVKKMRKEALAVQFREWTVDVSGRIPVALVQSALRSFLDVIASTPIDVRKAVYDKKLEVVNTLGKKVNIDEFTEYVHFYTEHFSDDMFQEILKHFRQCADDFQEAIRHDTWRRMFAELFLDRDYGKVGLLDRQKILALLVDFYDNSPVAAKRGFCNPRQWPIIELQDIELADLWGGLDDQEDIKTERQTESAKTNREEDYHMLDREPGSEGQVSQEGNNLIAEANSTISGPAPEAVTVTSEDRAVADTDIIASEQDAPVAEAVRETPARKESFSRQHGSQFDQQTSSETGQQDEDLVQDQHKGPAHSDRQDSPAEASQEFEVPWSGDLLTSDLTFRYSSYGEKIPEDWKHDNTKFPDLCPIMAEIQNRGASSTRSAFDKSCLNLPQFVQLMEIFVGEDISLPTVKRLVAFIKEEYKQTEEEKMEQLKKIHRSSHLAQRKLLLEALFKKWDNNASGFLDLEEVDAVLSTFKEGMEKEALRKAKQHLCSRYPQLSRVKKLSPEAFQTFLELVASEFTGDEDEAIDNLVEFLTTSTERSSTECLQSSTRRKWLHNIQQAAESRGASVEAVYKAAFKALSQDAEAHGDNKKISAYIALLEENQLSPERGQILLRYVACTTHDAPYVLNKILYRDMKGVSFTAVEEGKPIHVPRVQLHGNIHFWNYDRPVEERKGSLLVLPLQDAHWRVFGILGVDTLRDQCEKTIFLTHEISFYQGVSHAFSKAYHHVHTLKNVLQMTVTALDWLYPRAPSIHTVTTYLVEPGKDKTCDYALRKMVTKENTGQKEIHSSPELLLRKENLLRDYLFKCTDSSAVIHASVCREQHIAVPLRDLSGRAFGLFDISIGHHQKLPPHEHKDLQKMLKVAQAACSEILKMSSEEPTDVLEAEHVANSRHAGILFHQFMLQDLRECIQKLDAESFAEMKSYVEPPALVHNTVKAVLLLLHPNWKDSEEIENWSQCKLKLDDNLIQEIYCFDPTAASVQVQAELLLACITGEHRAETEHQGWWPTQLLGHWVHTCLALAQGTSSPHGKKASF